MSSNASLNDLSLYPAEPQNRILELAIQLK
jgi:hypothetical protein